MYSLRAWLAAAGRIMFGHGCSDASGVGYIMDCLQYSIKYPVNPIHRHTSQVNLTRLEQTRLDQNGPPKKRDQTHSYYHSQRNPRRSCRSRRPSSKRLETAAQLLLLAPRSLLRSGLGHDDSACDSMYDSACDSVCDSAPATGLYKPSAQ